VDGDGFDDVIVGARSFDNGQTDEGRAFLYLGSAGGPSLTPDWTAGSNQDSASFGTSVSGAGDVNGDGFGDVIVGASGFTNDQSVEGRAFLYLGAAGGPSLAQDWTAESNQTYAVLGKSVSGPGDVNGDGFDDVVVGAYRIDNVELDEGRASLYLGSAGGLSFAQDWTAEGDQASAGFGISVSGAGDVDGDGFDDVIVGASAFTNGQSREGRAFLYLGQPDCNGNGVADADDIANGTSQDCNANGIPDECDIASGASLDCNVNGVPDECDTDCNSNAVPDDCDIANGTSPDCNANGIPDACDIGSGTSPDRNNNGVPDECDTDVRVRPGPGGKGVITPSPPPPPAGD
jgi:hypothetical protein